MKRLFIRICGNVPMGYKGPFHNFTFRFHSLIEWFGIDTRIQCAHPPDERFDYLWN
jgi:hypothetical protein